MYDEDDYSEEAAPAEDEGYDDDTVVDGEATDAEGHVSSVGDLQNYQDGSSPFDDYVITDEGDSDGRDGGETDVADAGDPGDADYAPTVEEGDGAEIATASGDDGNGSADAYFGPDTGDGEVARSLGMYEDVSCNATAGDTEGLPQVPGNYPQAQPETEDPSEQEDPAGEDPSEAAEQRPIGGDRATGGQGPSAAPAPALSETRDARGKITVSGTSGNDNISVTPHYTTASPGTPAQRDGVTVTNGGLSKHYLGADADRLIISGGAGNDRIHVDSSLTHNFDLRGGTGNDTIIGGGGNDTIYGGSGRDYLDGGRGNDTLWGWRGSDILYGGQGDDRVSGGTGRDFVEGGRGNDIVSGGGGNDVVSGGRGNDTVDGGQGNDRVYAGEGTDRITGGLGQDFLYADAQDTATGTRGDQVRTDMNFNANLGSSVRNASGNSQEFSDRLEQDMDLLRYSPTGQQMLQTLDSTGRALEMRETQDPNGGSANVMGTGGLPFMNPTTGAIGAKRDALINYNVEHNQFYGGNTPNRADDDWKDVMPIEELYHELSHAQDYMTGTLFPGVYGTNPYSGNDARDVGMNNRERDAVGLPIDHDANPNTPEQTVNRPELTENGLRREFGSQLRPTYKNS